MTRRLWSAVGWTILGFTVTWAGPGPAPGPEFGAGGFGGPGAVGRPTQLTVLSPAANGWPRVGGNALDLVDGAGLFTLETSENLRTWIPSAVLLHVPFAFADPQPLGAGRFYRLRTDALGATNDWANQLRFPIDPFFNAGECGSDRLRWAKFAIVLSEPYRVYFQDSSRFLLHVDFATNRLAEFRNLSPAEFDAVSLHRETQRVVLGTVIASLDTGHPPEFAIQFAGADPYTREQIVAWFELVRSAVADAGSDARALYLPAYEQAAEAARQRDYLAARGIEVMQAERWLGTSATCYSAGWAVGRLQFVTAAELGAAYADGRLRPTDILLTDGVPAEVPFVAGLISLVPATPNSHVAILAQSYGVPFASVGDVEEQNWLLGRQGRTVAFRTGATLADCAVRILDLDNAFPPAVAAYVDQLKATGPIEFPWKAEYGSIAAASENLTPADARYFGGKAANFGLLRRVLPDNSPDAIAFSFDLWDAFLGQALPGGGTLREAIHTRLDEFHYPPDVTRLRARLAEIRSLIRNTARFTPAQQQEILARLARFDRSRNIRFRSSTNVEDAERFSGAGLYDSYSGCLEDDLDGDDAGPSACDPTEVDERGVFRAIQRVYASFYNENAVLERLRLQVPEDHAGMALLVHHSTPDPLELANGVATLTITRLGSMTVIYGQLVTQNGAVSIANPDGSARPEVLAVQWTASAVSIEPRESSSLVPFGTRVLPEADYPELLALLARATQEYARPFTNRESIELDFEYKREAPGHLSVKQVREVPSLGGTNSVPTFLLSAPAVDLFPWGSILAVHRLKSVWNLSSRSVLLDAGILALNCYGTTRVELLDDGLVREFVGNPADWPGAVHRTTATGSAWVLEDDLVLGAGSGRRRLTLETRLARQVPPTQCPWLHLGDAQVQWTAGYETAVPNLGPTGPTGDITNETVTLLPAVAGGSGTTDELEASSFSVHLSAKQSLVQLIGSPADGLGPDPRCVVVGPKASYGFLGVLGQTTILGLLPEPVVLTGRYAQTHLVHGRQAHERIQELFCEPGLDPALPATQRAALAALNVRAIYFRRFDFVGVTERMLILGWDGTFRDVP